MLHITNGDAVVDLLRAARLEGFFLPWRDVLHEGPVPDGLDLDALRAVRARFLADQGWGRFETTYADLAHRDGVLRAFRQHKEVVLWFEHDLYDQLQIAQILDWFAGRDLGTTTLTMICIGEHPDVHPFHGLGNLSPDQLAALFVTRAPVGPDQLTLAAAVWQAFRSDNPTGLETLLRTDTSALPFMADALRRHLRQFPSVRNGLSQTEQQALVATAGGLHDPVSLFRAHGSQEQNPFLGDLTLWAYLKRLARGPHPLLRIDGPPGDDRFIESILTVTEDGRRVLAGECDAVELNGIDQWLGGAHLHGGTARWRWDEQALCLLRATE